MKRFITLLTAITAVVMLSGTLSAAGAAQGLAGTAPAPAEPMLHLTFGADAAGLQAACAEAHCPTFGQAGKYQLQDAVQLQADSQVAVGSLDSLGLRGKSFTIVVRLKVDDVGQGVQQILGAGDLVLGLLDGRPYMNFGQNGLTGQTQLLPHKWYDLGWRYNAETGEMAVLVDGMAEKIVTGRPALQRSGELVLGAGLAAVVDDLRIYAAALTGAELLTQQQRDAGALMSSAQSGTAATARTLNFTVSLNCNPTGADRDKYISALGYFADGIYEMTNGINRVGNIQVYTNAERWNQSHIRWDCGDGRANANSGGYPFAASHGARIQMYNSQGGFIYSPSIAGYVLTHEAGHYVYGLYDEYREVGRASSDWLSSPLDGDTPVQFSAMHNTDWAAGSTQYICYEWYPWWQFWNWGRCARGENRYVDGDLRWLNLSTQANDTRNTAQYRSYNASGWGTLVRPPANDPREGARTNLLTRSYQANYPEFVGNGINLNALPPIEMPGLRSVARSGVTIMWGGSLIPILVSSDLQAVAGGAVREYLVDTSTSMTADRLATVKQILNDEIANAREGDSVGILSFDSTVVERQALTALTASNRASIQAVVTALTLGGTPGVTTGDALYEAHARLTATDYITKSNSIYLIGTGASTAGRTSAALIAPLTSASIPVYSFAYGASADDGNTLRDLAEQTSGLYTEVADGQALINGLQAANRSTSLTLFTGVKTGYYDKAPVGGSSDGSFSIDVGLSLIDATVWYGAAPGDFTLELIAPDGTATPFDTASCDDWSAPGDPLAACYLSIDAKPGSWKLHMVNNSAAESWAWYFIDGWAQAGVTSYSASVEPADGNVVQYPRPILVSATVGGRLPVAKAGVVGEVMAPDGTYQTFTMRDDGIAPDSLADDGKYAAYVDYWTDGEYEINVQFDNDANTATFTTVGTTNMTAKEVTPVGENLHRYGEATVKIAGWKADDHTDTITGTATTLPPDNTFIPGRIDRAGDVDFFKVDPVTLGVTDTKALFLRVDHLGLEMDPSVIIYDKDYNQVDEAYFDYTPGSTAHLFIPLTKVTSGEVFYVSVQHYQDTADTGTYELSIGPRLLADPKPDTGVGFTSSAPAPYKDFPYPVGPGGQVTFTHTFTHTGTTADSFVFTAKSWDGWPLTLKANGQQASGDGDVSLTLQDVAPGSAFSYTVQVTAPATATLGTRADISVTAQAQTASWLYTSLVDKIGVSDPSSRIYLPMISR